MTPGKARRLSASNCSTSPTSPTIVRCTPRLTNAEPPAACTVATTPSSSSAVASGDITTTMRRVWHGRKWRSDFESLDDDVGRLSWSQLDEIHGHQDEQGSDESAWAEAVAA